MNVTKFLPLALAVALLAPQHAGGQCITCPCPVGTAFTYQGFLTCTNNAGKTVNVIGDCDLEFRLFDCDTDPSLQQGPTLSFTFTGSNAVAVQEGEFTIGLDFGDVYDGEERWLEITIVSAPNPCVGANVTLTPRQELTPVPHALYAAEAPWDGLADVPGDFADGTDDDTLAGLLCTDGEIAKWNNGATQWECATDDSGVGAASTLDEAYDGGGAGAGRTITADAGAVQILGPGGLTVGNTITIDGFSTPNTISSDDAEALELHVASGRALRLEPNATSPNLIGGYSGNSVESGTVGATTSGGGAFAIENRVFDNYGTVGGGLFNRAGSDDADPATARSSTVSGGENNSASDFFATVGGGTNNAASERGSTVSGGSRNAASENSSTVGGGASNVASGVTSTVGGGWFNTASEDDSTIGGGRENTASGIYSTISGGEQNTTIGQHSSVGGGASNVAGGLGLGYATVSGGVNNTAIGVWSTVAGGISNTASGHASAVGGGSSNTASAFFSTVGGGGGNSASEDYSTVGGGDGNTTSAQHASVGGGRENTASGVYSAVGGGWTNIASGQYATVPGGVDNAAIGSYSFAAGRRAKAGSGQFVWADQNDLDFPSAIESNFTSAVNQFLARTTGGVVFVSAIDGVTGDSTAGVELAAGGGSWSSLSDRNAKANVDKVDGREILQRLQRVPIATWNYKAQDESIRHIGPMAQDFYAAFGVGEKETMITTIDADGVALAAIQGLYEIVKEKDAEIGALGARVTELENVVRKMNPSTRASTLGLTTPALAIVGFLGFLAIGSVRRRGGR